MAAKEELVLDPADFRSIEIHLELYNSTTNTEIKAGKRFYGGKSVADPDAKIELVEFTDDGLVIDAPKRACASGHVLMIRIRTKGSKAEDDMDFEVRGTVTAVATEDESRDIITLRLSDFEEYDWYAFQRVFSKRQEQILEFLEAVKP